MAEWVYWLLAAQTAGMFGMAGTGIKFFLDYTRQRAKDRKEAADFGIQTDINLDQARLIGVKGLMDQLDYYQAIIKNLRLEIDLLRERYNMVVAILEANHITLPVIEKGGVVKKEDFI